MIYLLDTDILSQFSRGHDLVLKRVKDSSPASISISSITIMEIEYGLALQAGKARILRPVLESFFESITILSYNTSDAKASASIRAGLRTKGTPIGAYDALIAGTALAKGLILVTGNTREFSRVGGLRIENWITGN